MACDDCGKEAQFVLEDGSEYCCDCLIDLAQQKKDDLIKLGGIDELDVVAVMMKEKVSKSTAITRLKERGGEGERRG